MPMENSQFDIIISVYNGLINCTQMNKVNSNNLFCESVFEKNKKECCDFYLREYGYPLQFDTCYLSKNYTILYTCQYDNKSPWGIYPILIVFGLIIFSIIVLGIYKCIERYYDKKNNRLDPYPAYTLKNNIYESF